ncbi:phage antirepressor [Nocardia tengchongensis]|uniref:phage antirepressor n=1 Tax=Nocardia tengchongensis TaxID=2055889 RepID=UPI003666921F
MQDQSTAQLVPFNYGQLQVRVVAIAGEPWFVLTDLCKVLAISDVSIVRRRLDDALCQAHPIHDSLGRTQQATIVNESGMYEVVIRSDKPEAVAFRRWITGTVLPEIRRTGSFVSAVAPVLELPDRKALARMVIEAEEAREVAEARSLVLAEKIAEDAPKVAMADDFLIAPGGARLVREAAKLLDMRERDLRRFLLDEKLIFAKHAPCGTVQYDHYAQFAHHFKATEHVVNHTWGSCTHYTLTILPRGIELIQKRRGSGQLAVGA